jgi:hypothetical protein
MEGCIRIAAPLLPAIPAGDQQCSGEGPPRQRRREWRKMACFINNIVNKLIPTWYWNAYLVFDALVGVFEVSVLMRSPADTC